jgi:cytochrome c oxidase cbb3-type subunit 3
MRYVLCVVGVAVAALVPRASAAQEPDTAVATSAAITAGRAIYHGAGTCATCHGANLEGAVGPALTAHSWKDAKGGSYAAILDVVTKGVHGTAMPPRAGGINDAEARQVAAYVWAVSQSKTKP